MYRYNVTSDRIGSPAVGVRPRGSYIFSAIVTLVDMIAVWQDRRRQRRALARLDDRMLRDIGVTSVDVQAEVSKPFWR